MKAWWIHVALLLVGLGTWNGYRSASQTDQELHVQLDTGTSREKVYAMHVLTNRGSSPHVNRAWDRKAITELMNHDDPLLVDFAYTIDVCRMVQPVWQEGRIGARLQNMKTGEIRGETFPEWVRHFLLYRRKVAGRHLGGMLRLQRQEVEWLIASIRGEELDHEAVLFLLAQRQTTANVARAKRMAAPDKEGHKERMQNARDNKQRQAEKEKEQLDSSKE